MSETSTTASTFEPDIEKLARAAYHNHFDFPEWPDVTAIEKELWHQTVQAVIAEYQRHAAAAGLVMVPLDDFAALTYAPVNPAIDERIYDRLEALVDAAYDARGATPEPAPGGDGP